ncbi:mechanosensitive ion channel family protein [Cryobacterium sp. 1639]|uniref:mechanosensitive ion channel family protein n=1 Tax=Cryobacterium inferilacus TaxID=2866629 RepID=UPI001C72C229|nr:mechanosensitive ion channel domain-containing protein [Cryobacterium sp. 1639]MBX0298590.1 mechanosensitive ion channel family protein [Cryobacterium sp. 1639]
MNWDTFWATADTIWNLTIVQVAVIILFAFLARWVLLFVIRRVVTQIVSGVKKGQNVDDTQSLDVSPVTAVRVVQRTRTLGSVLTNIVNVLIVIVAILLIVTEINPGILGSFALLTAALGAGLGFGAQNIVKDVLNGLFMVMEDQLGVGDVVDLGLAEGVVESVGIRITQVRDIEGTLWFVRNGEILRTGNMSQGWARVIVDLAIPYSSDVEAVQAELLKVARALASSRKWRSAMLGKPEIWGLESISAEALVVRLVVRTRVGARWDFARDLRLHLKKALDGMGSGLTPLNSVVMAGADGSVSAGSGHVDDSTAGAPSDAAAQAAAALPTTDTAPFEPALPARRVKAPRRPKRAPTDPQSGAGPATPPPATPGSAQEDSDGK